MYSANKKAVSVWQKKNPSLLQYCISSQDCYSFLLMTSCRDVINNTYVHKSSSLYVEIHKIQSKICSYTYSENIYMNRFHILFYIRVFINCIEKNQYMHINCWSVIGHVNNTNNPFEKPQYAHIPHIHCPCVAVLIGIPITGIFACKRVILNVSETRILTARKGSHWLQLTGSQEVISLA